MLNQYHNEKTIHAAIFFMENTQGCKKTKLLKLLYILDFEHYRQIGRTVTGLKYEAWEGGPVAPEIFTQFRAPSGDWEAHIEITHDPAGFQKATSTWTPRPKAAFDPQFFSKRELALLQDIANRYKSTTATALVNLCHNTPPWNLPWKEVWENQNREDGEISPELFLMGATDAEGVAELAREHEAMVKNYQ
ncbi:MAG: SocA family protein [Candidatus Latescibacteria bacterium]|nr:SocA family protein [Candidatus Latescibacterota bacterium]